MVVLYFQLDLDYTLLKMATRGGNSLAIAPSLQTMEQTYIENSHYKKFKAKDHSTSFSCFPVTFRLPLLN